MKETVQERSVLKEEAAEIFINGKKRNGGVGH